MTISRLMAIQFMAIHRAFINSIHGFCIVAGQDYTPTGRDYTATGQDYQEGFYDGFCQFMVSVS